MKRTRLFELYGERRLFALFEKDEVFRAFCKKRGKNFIRKGF